MQMNWRRGVVVLLFFAAGLSGCRKSEVVPEAEPEDVTRLGDKTPIDLSEWLSWPRDKLAAEVQAIRDTAVNQQKAARETLDSAGLLPSLRLSVAAPVLDKAEFAADPGFSRPPYLAGKFDADLALHLAHSATTTLRCSSPTPPIIN